MWIWHDDKKHEICRIWFEDWDCFLIYTKSEDDLIQCKFFLTAQQLLLHNKTALKKTKLKVHLLTDIDVLLIVKKGTIGGIWHAFYQYAKAKNKYIKDYVKNKELSCLKYWDVNNLHGWEMSQKLAVNGFKFVKYISEFNEDLIKPIIMKVMKGFSYEIHVQCPENITFTMIYPFCLKEWKLKKLKNF